MPLHTCRAADQVAAKIGIIGRKKDVRRRAIRTSLGCTVQLTENRNERIRDNGYFTKVTGDFYLRSNMRGNAAG